MKILTKLMLASAVMVTSGFALPEDPVIDPDPVIDGTLEMKSGAEWETTKDHTITSAGAITLEKADVEGEGARWIISEGNTINVQGGSVTVVGEGAYGPKINLNGTMKLTKTSGGDYPEINLNGTEVAYLPSRFNVGSGSGEYRLTTEPVFEFGEQSYFGITDGLSTLIPTDASYYSARVLLINEKGITFNRKETKEVIRNLDIIVGGYEISFALRMIDGFKLGYGLYYNNYMDLAIFKDGDTIFAVDEYTVNFSQRDYGDVNLKVFATVDWTNSDVVTCNLVVLDDIRTNTLTVLSSGTVDASPLRSFAQTATAVEDLSSNITGINPTALAEVKLPFNCKFGTEATPGMNLSNVDKVSYTKFVKGKTYETEVADNIIGMKEIAGGTYGDYSNDADLGVVLPADESKLAVTEEKTDDGVNTFDLKIIAEDATYNAEDGNLKINTTYLSAKAHELAGDFTYNVGFTGAGNPINVSGDGYKTIFKGDASGYAPTGDITLTNKTVYAGNNSFIKVNHAYDELEFTAAATGQTLANEIPSGVEVSATKFSVGKGHTLTVKGKLRA